MLALMPRSSLPLDPYKSKSVVESRTTLPFLPSTPMTYGQPHVSATFSLSPSPTKKPKLTLNTATLSPVVGKGATSLTLEKLSATSPTARNTFRNRKATNANVDTEPQKSLLTPISTKAEVVDIGSCSPSQVSLPDSAETTDISISPVGSETSSVSSVDSSPSQTPYKLPFNAASILTNGPIPRSKNRQLSFSQSRAMFPAPKRVGFRAELTEEIETKTYTLRHSDIASLPLLSTAETSGAKEEVFENNGDESLSKTHEQPTVTSPLKRDADQIEDIGEIHLVTPVAGRAKRHRWVWTLPPVQPASQQPASTVQGSGQGTAVQS